MTASQQRILKSPYLINIYPISQFRAQRGWLSRKSNSSIIFYAPKLLRLPKQDPARDKHYESKDTRETNSRVIRPLDLVLMTKCSGYFLNNISRPYHGLPLDSGPG